MRAALFTAIAMISIAAPALGEQAFDRFDLIKVANPGQFQDIAVKVKSCRFEKGENAGTPEAFSFMCELQGSGQVQFTTLDYGFAEGLINAGPQTLSGTVIANQSGSFIVLRGGELDKYVNFVASTQCRQIEQREGWSDRKISCDGSKVKNCNQIVEDQRKKIRSKVDQQCDLVKKKVQELVDAGRSKGKAAH